MASNRTDNQTTLDLYEQPPESVGSKTNFEYKYEGVSWPALLCQMVKGFLRKMDVGVKSECSEKSFPTQPLYIIVLIYYKNI